MRPRKDDEALVDVLDVLLRDGAIVRADVIVSVADVPLVGIKLTAALAGMETMTEYGLFEEWDLERRRTGITRRGHYDTDRSPKAIAEPSTDVSATRGGGDGRAARDERTDEEE